MKGGEESVHREGDIRDGSWRMHRIWLGREVQGRFSDGEKSKTKGRAACRCLSGVGKRKIRVKSSWSL